MITCDAFLRTEKANCELYDYEKGTIIQLAGSDPEKFLKCSKIIESSDYSQININIGCPSNRVIKGSFGACLIKNPSIVAECIDAIKSEFTRTISIKTRLGFIELDSNSHAHIYFYEPIVNYFGVKPKDKFIDYSSSIFDN